MRQGASLGGLVLKLRPFEKLLVNGVLLENGDRSTRLRVATEGAHILRMRDALKPEEATTPVRRIYYIAQLAVAGMMAGEEAQSILRGALDEADDLPERERLEDSVGRSDFYKVMRCLRDEALPRRAGNAVPTG